MPLKTCPCGSGLTRRELYDAAGNFCCYFCVTCGAEKKAKYNPSIFDPSSDYAKTGEEVDIAQERKLERWRMVDEARAENRIADQIDGYDRDDLGESPDY